VPQHLRTTRGTVRVTIAVSAGQGSARICILEETRPLFGARHLMTDRAQGSVEFCFYRHSNKHAAFGGATCVQSFDDSQTSAIHITYHISLCSSSLHEPRDPSLKVVSWFCFCFLKREGTNCFARSRIIAYHTCICFSLILSCDS
jgi:hypothetical protein